MARSGGRATVRNDGWETLTVIAAHTDTVGRDMSEDEKFGLVHVIPGDYAGDLRETYDADEFTEYLACGRDVANSMFVVTEFIDAEVIDTVAVIKKVGGENKAKDAGYDIKTLITVDVVDGEVVIVDEDGD